MATVTWSAASAGNWSVAGNWTGGTGVPANGDAVVFDNTSLQNCTVDVSTNSLLSFTVASTHTAGTVSAGTGIVITVTGTVSVQETSFACLVGAGTLAITGTGNYTVPGQSVSIANVSLAASGQTTTVSTTSWYGVGSGAITLTLGTGTLAVGANTLLMWAATETWAGSGTITLSTGKIVSGVGGTVSYGASIVFPALWMGVDFSSGNRTTTLSSNLTVTGTLTMYIGGESGTPVITIALGINAVTCGAFAYSIAAGATVVATLGTTGSVVCSGNFTIPTAGTFTVTGNGSISCGGNWDSSAGTFNRGTGTVNLTGTGTVTNPAFANRFFLLTLAASGQTTTMSGNVLVSNTVTMGGGTLTIGSFTLGEYTENNQSSVLSGTGTITQSGTGVFSVNMDASVGATLGTSIAFWNLTFGFVATFGTTQNMFLAAALVVNNNLAIQAGGGSHSNVTVFNTQNNGVTVGGTFTIGVAGATNTVQFLSGSGTVTASGSVVINEPNDFITSAVNGSWSVAGVWTNSSTATASWSFAAPILFKSATSQTLTLGPFAQEFQGSVTFDTTAAAGVTYTLASHSLSVGSLVVQNTAGGASGPTIIAGNPLTLTAGPTVFGSGPVTISVPAVFGTLTISGAGAKVLGFSFTTTGVVAAVAVQLTITAATTWTLNGGNITGPASGTLTLRSSATGTQWILSAAGGTVPTAVAVDVEDSNASGGPIIIAYDPTDVNSGNNTNWLFTKDATVFASMLFTNQWTAANTDSVTPTIMVIYSSPREIRAQDSDFVLIYALPENERKQGIDYNFLYVTQPLSIDIRVARSSAGLDADPMAIRAHAIRVRDEARRILYANRRNPGAGFDEIRYSRENDLSDRMKRINRWTIDADFVKYADPAPATSTTSGVLLFDTGTVGFGP